MYISVELSLKKLNNVFIISAVDLKRLINQSLWLIDRWRLERAAHGLLASPWPTQLSLCHSWPIPFLQNAFWHAPTQQMARLLVSSSKRIIGSSIKKIAGACGPTRAGLGKVVNIRRDIKLGPIILRPTPCLFLLLEMEFFIRRVGLGFYLHCWSCPYQ